MLHISLSLYTASENCREKCRLKIALKGDFIWQAIGYTKEKQKRKKKTSMMDILEQNGKLWPEKFVCKLRLVWTLKNNKYSRIF